MMLLVCVGVAQGASLRATGCDCTCGACPAAMITVCGCPAIAVAPPKMVPVGTFSGKCACGQPAQPAACGCQGNAIALVPAVADSACACGQPAQPASCGCPATVAVAMTPVAVLSNKCDCACGSCPAAMISVCGCPAIAKAAPKMVPLGTFSGTCACGQPAQPVSCGCNTAVVSVPTVTVQNQKVLAP